MIFVNLSLAPMGKKRLRHFIPADQVIRYGQTFLGMSMLVAEVKIHPTVIILYDIRV